MKTINKLFAMLLALVAIAGATPVRTCAEDGANNQSFVIMPKRDIEEVVDDLQFAHPEAKIRIVDQTIHAVLDDSDPFVISSSNTKSTSVYAPAGGAFRDYNVPAFAMIIPLTQVFMNEDAVQARLLQLSRPDIFSWVKQQLANGLSVYAISILAKTVWGISIPSIVISIIASFTVWAFSNLDYHSLESAYNQSSSGKVQVYRYITSDGYFTLLYYSWNSNYCDTHGGYDATWYGGDYTF